GSAARPHAEVRLGGLLHARRRFETPCPRARPVPGSDDPTHPHSAAPGNLRRRRLHRKNRSGGRCRQRSALPRLFSRDQVRDRRARLQTRQSRGRTRHRQPLCRCLLGPRPGICRVLCRPRWQKAGKFSRMRVEKGKVHTPEITFAQYESNVERGVREFGLTYPIVVDNDREIWKAFANRYWPTKYLLDKDGYLRYAHFGEGAYTECEQAIRELLLEVNP